MSEAENTLKKVCIICSKGGIEDVYAALVLANGAVMEGMEAKLFFTFYGIDVISKRKMNKLQANILGNPTVKIPRLLGIIPGVHFLVSKMMKKRLDQLDFPPVGEFLEMITAGGGEIYACKLAMDMFKLAESDLCEHVKKVLTVGDFYGKCGGENTQIIYI